MSENVSGVVEFVFIAASRRTEGVGQRRERETSIERKEKERERGDLTVNDAKPSI